MLTQEQLFAASYEAASIANEYSGSDSLSTFDIFQGLSRLFDAMAHATEPTPKKED